MVIENKNYNIGDIVKIPMKCAPVYSIIFAVQRLLEGIVPTLEIIVTAKFIDTAILIVSEREGTSRIFPYLFLVVALIAYNWISKQLMEFVQIKLELNMRSKFRTAITEKRAKLSYKHVENKDTWDLISRISNQPEANIKNGYIELLSMISIILRVVGILVVLIAQIWWAPFVILAFSIPLFRLAIKSGKATYEADREVSKYKRKYEYLEEVLSGREAVEERSLFGFYKDISKKWWEQYEIARKIIFKTQLKWFVKMKSGSVVTAIISVLILLVLIKPVQSGALSLGMFISLANGIFALVQMMSWEITYQVDQLTKKREYLRDLTEFAALEEKKEAIDRPLSPPMDFKTLEFKKVKFKYPGTDNYVLKDLSFVIERGNHYAFVGINGAGKTTITKLITGLYDEFEGEILINGRNIREYGESELKSMCSVVYQDFAKYSIPLKSNISIGNIEGIDKYENDAPIREAISITELETIIEKLPEGIDTPLGKIKSSGMELSGGEWQRVAMARAVISQAPLRILDEPTAALDPISESSVYEKFESISKGKTTVFISHRLGSTKLAQEIFVIGEGRVIELGTHEELMSKQGIYAEMYDSQRGWYQC